MNKKITVVFHQIDKVHIATNVELSGFDIEDLVKKSAFFKTMIDNMGEQESSIHLEEEDVFQSSIFFLSIISSIVSKQKIDVWNDYNSKLSSKWFVESHVEAYCLVVKQHMDKVLGLLSNNYLDINIGGISLLPVPVPVIIIFKEML